MVEESRRSIGQLIREGERTFSFEFFPPKDEAGEAQLWQAIRELEPYHPTFVSVTYGAGGTTRDTTVEITARIAQETTMVPMAHLTCVGHTVEELRSVLTSLTSRGVSNVLALRGDPPGGPGTPWEPTEGGVNYASELIKVIKDTVDVSVGVAAFPEGHVEAASLDDDIAVLRAKQDMGAEFAVTDMVLRAADYFALVERARGAGVEIPIIPGVMPILNLNSMRRMVELSRRELPGEVSDRLLPLAKDPAALRAEGIRIATEMCEALLQGGAPGLHFYTLNRSKATREIFEALSISV